jgi:septal ring factor EnvC (AmiA/AmiB activator)
MIVDYQGNRTNIITGDEALSKTIEEINNNKTTFSKTKEDLEHCQHDLDKAKKSLDYANKRETLLDAESNRVRRMSVKEFRKYRLKK